MANKKSERNDEIAAQQRAANAVSEIEAIQRTLDTLLTRVDTLAQRIVQQSAVLESLTQRDRVEVKDAVAQVTAAAEAALAAAEAALKNAQNEHLKDVRRAFDVIAKFSVISCFVPSTTYYD